MRRFLPTVIATAALAAAAAGGSLAGAPGTNFPEQPGDNVQGGCAAVVSNPGTGIGGQAGHMSSTANGITGQLLADACFGG